MSLLNRRRALLSAKGGLPYAYQQVEYIEKQTNHIQYINTGIYASEKNKFEAKAQLLNVNLGSQTLYGGRNSAINGEIQGNQISFVQSNGLIQVCCGDTAYATILHDNNIHTYYDTTHSFYRDNEYIGYKSGETITLKNRVFLFATNTNGVASFSSGALRLYYAKIWNDNILVRDFIPCYRKSDNAAGLYDLVNGEFYTNKGTGEFILGGEV